MTTTHISLLALVVKFAGGIFLETERACVWRGRVRVLVVVVIAGVAAVGLLFFLVFSCLLVELWSSGRHIRVVVVL